MQTRGAVNEDEDPGMTLGWEAVGRWLGGGWEVANGDQAYQCHNINMYKHGAATVSIVSNNAPTASSCHLTVTIHIATLTTLPSSGYLLV